MTKSPLGLFASPASMSALLSLWFSLSRQDNVRGRKRCLSCVYSFRTQPLAGFPSHIIGHNRVPCLFPNKSPGKAEWDDRIGPKESFGVEWVLGWEAMTPTLVTGTILNVHFSDWCPL